MELQFNPFTGKLDIVGVTKQQLVEDQLIDEGIMYEAHGGLKANTDFSQTPMSAKAALEKVLFPEKPAVITASDWIYKLIGEGNIKSDVKFTITKKSYTITSVSVSNNNGSIVRTFTDAELSSLNTTRQAEITISAEHSTDCTYTCTIQQQGASNVTAQTGFQFHYPLLWGTCFGTYKDKLRIITKPKFCIKTYETNGSRLYMPHNPYGVSLITLDGSNASDCIADVQYFASALQAQLTGNPNGWQTITTHISNSNEPQNNLNTIFFLTYGKGLKITLEDGKIASLPYIPIAVKFYYANSEDDTAAANSEEYDTNWRLYYTSEPSNSTAKYKIELTN